VGELEDRLRGPAPDRIENMRRKFSASYRQIAAEAGADALPLRESEYVAHFLGNYTATYQARSARALGEIGTRRAIEAIREAARDTTYRDDVLDEINRALADTIEVVRGNGQVGHVGEPLPDTIAVRVADRYGGSVLGHRVNFSATPGNGRVTGGTAITDSVTGVATLGSWTLGPVPGAQRLDVRSGDLAGTVMATATDRLDTVLMLNAGDQQSAPVGTAVPIPPSVLVTDGGGGTVPGVAVVFVTFVGNDPNLVGTVLSDSVGVASLTQWVMGATEGQYRLQATADGSADTVRFSATATRQPPASMSAVRGDSQVGMPGMPLPVPPSVLVLDSGGHPVPSVPVLFSVIEGGGRVDGDIPLTDSLGVATVGSWTLGPDTVRNRLTASTVELRGVVFWATARPGTCLSFSDLTVGDEFNVGDSIVTDSVGVSVEPFLYLDGSSTATGDARVDDRGYAGGSGLDVNAGNVNLSFEFAFPGQRMYLAFGELGGNVNLRVNGDTANVGDMVDLDGTSLGGLGVSVLASQTGNNWFGTLSVDGAIRDFAIGGQELWIDDVCFLTGDGTMP
jgi:hypothetical protein